MILKNYMLRLSSSLFLEISCQSWDYMYFICQEIILMEKISSEGIYVEEVMKKDIP